MVQGDVYKRQGFWIIKEYRDAYGMFCCNGILFNHESERRGETFVTRKITLAAARIAQGLQDKLYLGNLDSLRAVSYTHLDVYKRQVWCIVKLRWSNFSYKEYPLSACSVEATRTVLSRHFLDEPKKSNL